jgi:hypothetical protein
VRRLRSSAMSKGELQLGEDVQIEARR